MKPNAIQKAASTPTVEKSTQYIAGAVATIEDQLTYDEVQFCAKELSKAVKAIEEARKEATKPLDEAKKALIAQEREYTEPMLEAIAKAKANMADYLNQIAAAEEAARQKRNEEMAKALEAGNIAQAMQQALTPEVVIDKPKGVRTIRRAVLLQGASVDWNAVVQCLVAAGKFDPDMLLKGLPEAMRITGTENIAGVDIVEQQIQTLI
jgi:formate dehydrogenase maturation protein FdhE